MTAPPFPGFCLHVREMRVRCGNEVGEVEDLPHAGVLVSSVEVDVEVVVGM